MTGCRKEEAMIEGEGAERQRKVKKAKSINIKRQEICESSRDGLGIFKILVMERVLGRPSICRVLGRVPSTRYSAS